MNLETKYDADSLEFAKFIVAKDIDKMIFSHAIAVMIICQNLFKEKDRSHHTNLKATRHKLKGKITFV